MEFIVCGDNHGLITPLEKLVENYPNVESFLHCGDCELDPSRMTNFQVVTGNNDYFYHYPEELIVEVGDIKVLITHGHQYYGNRVDRLASRAINHHCDVVCYGHTHVYDVQVVKGILCINPGSLRYNRDGSRPTYAHVIKNENGFEVNRKNVADLK